MQWLGMKEDEIIESKAVSRAIELAQERVEKHNFELRKHLIEYDDVLNQQRVVVYQYRRDALEGEEQIYALVRDMIINVIKDLAQAITLDKSSATEAQVQEIISQLVAMTRLPKELFAACTKLRGSVELEKALSELILEQYQLLRHQHAEITKQAEKWVLLETIDEAWKQHMLNLDHLKEGIGLRGWGQKNPLIEYKREAFAMFKEMMETIRMHVVRAVFHITVDHINTREIEARRQRELAVLNLVSAGSQAAEGRSSTNPGSAPSSEPQVGRNEQCPCGSGKKYKKCCGAK